MPTKKLFVVLAMLFVCVGVAYAADVRGNVPTQHPENATIGAGNPSFDDLLKRFSDLAKDKGAEYAFDVLRQATLPPGVDIHLIAHEIGHELYEQQGIDGMSICTQEFGNGCSHSLVIEAMQQLGDGADVRKLIDDACHKAERAPDGGLTAYTMCYHGLGHGVFAYYQYSWPETIAFCEKMSTKEYRNIQGQECVGGAAMELVSGGGHDKEAWQAANDKYFSASDPLAPCNAPFIPADSQPKCFVYMSPHYMEYAGANIEVFTPEQLTKGMGVCAALPQGMNRDSCIGGFGKDFVGLVSGHDLRVRDSGKYTDIQMLAVENLCKHAPTERDVHVCESYAESMFFWGGFAEPSASVRFCSVLSDDASKDFCFTYLAYSISDMIANPHERSVRCADLGEKYQKACLQGIR